MRVWVLTICPDGLLAKTGHLCIHFFRCESIFKRGLFYGKYEIKTNKPIKYTPFLEVYTLFEDVFLLANAKIMMVTMIMMMMMNSK